LHNHPDNNMIQIQKKPFGDVPQFSLRDKAYTLENERLREFSKYQVSLNSFKEVIEDRKRFPVDRQLLVKTLIAQYENYGISNAENQQLIRSLESENTFTVITAHQPSLFTGPLYFVYKILSTVHLSRVLAKEYPEYSFVPVFVSGGEDHDFEEINHLQLFNQKVTWENDESGPVGKMDTSSLSTALEAMKSILGEQPAAKDLFEKLSKHYASGRSFGQATLSFVNELFEQYGLIVFNMDNKALKSAFVPVIKKEIFEQASAPLVNETQDKLSAAGFKSQAHAREINFFYMKKGMRERIVFENNKYKVLNTTLEFSKAELDDYIDKNPDHFSPNVVTRPLYQETILPNLAYIGGGGELAYWLERKSQFEAFGVFYPMLIRRNSVLWVDAGSKKKIEKFGLELENFFGEKDSIVKSFVNLQATSEFDFSNQIEGIASQIDKLISEGKQVDLTLGKALEAEKTRLMKSVDQMTNRIVRAEKQKHDVAIKQIEKLKTKLFPKNGLQERVDNFIPFYLKHGDTFFDTLLKELNPLEKDMVIVFES